MDTHNTPGDPPEKAVTIDQVIAANMRYWRREARMTQEELGKLIGQSDANVSALERSADDNREKRRFDAQAITEIALALGVPIPALFLPPADDRAAAEYIFTTADGRSHGMAAIVEHGARRTRTATPTSPTSTGTVTTARPSPTSPATGPRPWPGSCKPQRCPGKWRTSREGCGNAAPNCSGQPPSSNDLAAAIDRAAAQ